MKSIFSFSFAVLFMAISGNAHACFACQESYCSVAEFYGMTRCTVVRIYVNPEEYSYTCTPSGSSCVSQPPNYCPPGQICDWSLAPDKAPTVIQALLESKSTQISEGCANGQQTARQALIERLTSTRAFRASGRLLQTTAVNG